MNDRNGDLVLVSDVHIGRDDPQLPEFLAFLGDLAGKAGEVVLLGDIFSLWLGLPRYTEAHHRAVLEACRNLRRTGTRVVFIEGNREFYTRYWRGGPFDEVDEQLARAAWSSRNWYLAHGDLINRDDRWGRAFRNLVRSLPMRFFALALPRSWGIRLGEKLEAALRHRNLRHKTSIPHDRFQKYSSWLARRGFEAGAIGHIHVEMRLDLCGPDGRMRSLFVLPDWRSTHRYLRIPKAGEPFFDGWGERKPSSPAVVEAVEDREGADLRFDRPPGFQIGQRIELSSGHETCPRAGRVVQVFPDQPDRFCLALDPGPPVQVGDRVRSKEDPRP